MPKFPPTSEQQAVIDAVRTGQDTAIEAYAGAGKTATLEMVAEVPERPEDVLFIVYNTRNKIEAEERMPKGVVCKTSHGLAFGKFGKQMIDRIKGQKRLSSRDIAIAFGLKGTLVCGRGTDHELRLKPPQLVSIAQATVAKFQYSKDDEIAEKHVAIPEGAEQHADLIRREIVGLARRIWQQMIDPKGIIKPSHDTYLKQWALSKPRLRFKVVMVDEAQDMNECMAGVLELQTHLQLVVVGDSYQTLYGWRGAVDYLAQVKAQHRLPLSQSWRFGQEVADEANVWLSVVAPGANAAVRGNPGLTSELRPLAFEETDAVLCRSNAGTITELLDAHNAGVKVHLVGEGIEMRMLAEAAIRMQAGEYADHPDLAAFKTWEEVVKYAEEDPGGSDLAVSVRMIEKYGAETVVRVIKGCCKNPEDADLIVSTAHKSKGLEWDRVRVANDFRQPIDDETGEPLPIDRAEAMLAYVTVTRAKKVLDTGGLGWIHEHLAALNQPAVAA